MIPLKDDRVVPTVIATYNRIKTYRPHLSEENRRVSVKKSMRTNYGLNLSDEKLDAILGPYKPNVRAVNDTAAKKNPLLINRTLFKGDFNGNNLPINRKRELPTDQRLHSTLTPFSHNTKINKTDTGKVTNLRSSKATAIGNIKSETNISRASSNVFERLYGLRSKPVADTVELVKKTRDSEVKSVSKRLNSFNFHEPSPKRVCYSRDSLNTTNSSNSSTVFDRLYEQRKQHNTKKFTDKQKRENYLRKQREQMRNSMSISRWMGDFSNVSRQQSKCEYDLSSSTETISSDGHEKFLRNQLLDDTLSSNFNDSNVFNSTMNADGDDTLIENSNTKDVQDFLDSLSVKFSERMSLCHISEKELTE